MRVQVQSCVMLAALVISFHAAAQEAYLCIEDMATGFKYNKERKEWSTTTFKTDDKYLLTRPKDRSDELKWVVRLHGREHAIAVCEKDFNDIGNMWCGGLYHFNINRNTLRFVIAYLHGYYQDGNPAAKDNPFSPGSDSPYIAMGRCSRL